MTDRLDCPKCKKVGLPHFLVVGQTRIGNCDKPDCGWRSCMQCAVTWSVKTLGEFKLAAPPAGFAAPS